MERPRVAEMVARLEPCERGQPAWQPGQRVEVDQPQVDAVGEGAPYPLASGVRHDGVVECGRERGGGHAGLPACAESRRGTDAGQAAVLVEAPAVVGAGERDPVRAQVGQAALRGE